METLGIYQRMGNTLYNVLMAANGRAYVQRRLLFFQVRCGQRNAAGVLDSSEHHLSFKRQFRKKIQLQWGGRMDASWCHQRRDAILGAANPLPLPWVDDQRFLVS